MGSLKEESDTITRHSVILHDLPAALLMQTLILPKHQTATRKKLKSEGVNESRSKYCVFVTISREGDEGRE